MASLRFEPLESRLLLSGTEASVEYTYKSMAFEASGAVSGEVVGTDGTTTYNGIGSAEGVIHYTSSLSGAGTATVDSVGTSTSDDESAPYTYEGMATITDDNGQVTFDISSDQIPLVVTGEFSSLTFIGSASWDEDLSTDSSVSGSWSGPFGPSDSARPDIVVESANWIDGGDASAEFSVRVDGPVVPAIGGRDVAVGDVQLYWAEIANNSVELVEGPLSTTDVWWNMEACEVAVTGLPVPGPRATHLYIVADEFDLVQESNENNNVATLAIPGAADVTQLGTIDYLEVTGQQLAAGGLRYEFQATRDGCVTIQAPNVVDLTSLGIDLLDSDGTTLASTQGEGRLDYWQGQQGVTYFARVTGEAAVDLAFVNLVQKEGTEVSVHGTGSDDTFEFVAGTPYEVTINGTGYDFEPAQCETVVFNGGEGGDEATLHGGSESEIARLWPDHGTFGENGFLVTANDVVSITAHGGGGADSAFMYDSPGNDEFVTYRDYGRLSGQGFALETFDFMYNYGYATTRDGGSDTARMEDTSLGDKFKFDWPKEGQFFGKMYGGGLYYNRAKNFEQIDATMTEGKDTVRLFDSEGNDTFFAQRDESRMTGPAYDLTVSGYDSIVAYASKGNDIAHLEDSPEDDATRARQHKVILWGGDYGDPTYTVTARKFDEYHFEARNGGYDTAKLHDTVLDDFAEASGNMVSLYSNDGGLSLLYETVAFDWVRLYGTPNNGEVQNHNTISKSGDLTFDLVYDPNHWDEVL